MLSLPLITNPKIHYFYTSAYGIRATSPAWWILKWLLETKQINHKVFIHNADDLTRQILN